MSTDNNIIEELTSSPENFDLGAFITSKVQFPTRDVKLVLDYEGSAEAYDLASQIADKHIEVEAINEEAKAGITGGDTEALDGEIATLTGELTDLVAKLEAEALTFTLRGIAPKVWRLFDKEARRKFPNDKNATEEVRLEADIDRSTFANRELVKACTVKITAPNGGVQEGKSITHATIAGLHDVVAESEWDKLLATANELTFQVGAFDQVVSQDADFLPTASV